MLIAAAGNNGVTSEFYPAANVNVMAVAASDQNDARASFSNYGSWVDIAAPGTSILSTMYDDTYAWWSGTSMAAPFVAGAAGLLLSYDPTLTVNEVKAQLVASGDDINWGGAGPAKRLNVYQALLAAVGQPPDPMLRTGVVEGVNSAWTTVNLDTTYTSMVVVCSANYYREKAPGVVRVKIPASGGGNSFDVRVDSAGGGAINDVTVCYMVVEEGVYNVAQHGVKMEAVKYTSTVTDQINAWNGELRSYSNSYTNPAVVGQVMSYNDGRWSVFWCRGSSRANPPTSTFRVGKHVGEDPDTSRLDETIGYIVIEAGNGTISATDYVAGLGADTIFGVNNSPPYNYPLSGLTSPFPTAIVSQAGMDGANGGWAVLYGANPVTSSSLGLAIDEDQAGDVDRGHGSEQVAYIVFDTPGIPAAPQLLAKADLEPESPPVAALLQNYPNPFNPETWIPFRLSELEYVVIGIYNVTGQLVRRFDLGPKAPGDYINKENAAYWDGRNESGEQVSSGVYFYTIQAGGFAATKKLTIQK